MQLVLVGENHKFQMPYSDAELYPTALKCDLREDRNVQERLARYGMSTVQYEEGLQVARRIRASRYLGSFSFFFLSHADILKSNPLNRMQRETQPGSDRSLLRGSTSINQFSFEAPVRLCHLLIRIFLTFSFWTFLQSSSFLGFHDG